MLSELHLDPRHFFHGKHLLEQYYVGADDSVTTLAARRALADRLGAGTAADEEAFKAAVLEATGEVDILVTNAGGPPPGMWHDWNREDFIKALDANMLTPIAMMKALLPSMMERGWGRVVNITSQSVKAPIPQLGLSNSARAGLTGYVAGTARQVAPMGVVINNLLPGSHDTDRRTALDRAISQKQGIAVEEATRQVQADIPAGQAVICRKAAPAGTGTGMGQRSHDSHHRIGKTAKKLGMPLRTLQYKMKKYQLRLSD